MLRTLANFFASQALGYFDSFYRSGSLVFGGGHVVLPLLEAEVVGDGWMGQDAFLAGYGAAQALPGPLFAFSAYLGAAMDLPPHGALGGSLCLVAIHLPSCLLVVGVLPIWDRARAAPAVQAALKGTNAVVVGILLACTLSSRVDCRGGRGYSLRHGLGFRDPAHDVAVAVLGCCVDSCRCGGAVAVTLCALWLCLR